MVYTKNTWVDQAGQVRYQESVDQDNLLILTPNYEQVTRLGTPVNATNMNHIEDGIADCYVNLVNKTGTETIAGLKTFTDIPTVEKANYPRFCLRTTDWTRGTNPSSSSNAGMIIQDSNNDMGNSHRLGEFVTQLSTNGSVYSEMRTYKNVVENTSAYIRVGFNTAGESYAECPNPKESSNTNNIATTKWVKDFAATSGSNYMSTFSKGAAGYYKFTNGLIIQWSNRDAMSRDGNLAITFPIAFSNTNYSFVDCATRTNVSTSNPQACASIKNGTKTTTGLTLMQDTYADDGGQWIAIGY